MNLSPSQNNLLKTLGIIPLKVTLSSLQASEPVTDVGQQDNTLSISANLLLDLQVLLPELEQVVVGSSFSITPTSLVVPQEFSFSSLDKKQLWQFLHQQNLA